MSIFGMSKIDRMNRKTIRYQRYQHSPEYEEYRRKQNEYIKARDIEQKPLIDKQRAYLSIINSKLESIIERYINEKDAIVEKKNKQIESIGILDGDKLYEEIAYGNLKRDEADNLIKEFNKDKDYELYKKRAVEKLCRTELDNLFLKYDDEAWSLEIEEMDGLKEIEKEWNKTATYKTEEYSFYDNSPVLIIDGKIEEFDIDGFVE